MNIERIKITIEKDSTLMLKTCAKQISFLTFKKNAYVIEKDKH